MKTRVIIRLDNRRAKKDGTYPLSIRIYRNNSAVDISTGYSLLEKDWDAKKRKVRNSYKGAVSVTKLNRRLLKKMNDYSEQIEKLEELKKLEGLSNVELKERLLGQESKTSFCAYAQKLIKQLEDQKRIGTARGYRGIVQVILKYRKGKDMRFEEITYNFLNKFETDYLSRGNSINGLSVYMRTIRSIYNKAMKDGIVSEEHYPFNLYTIKSEPTKKRAIEIDKIKLIEELELEEDTSLFHTKNYFMFSFYLIGISFSDLARIKKTDIENGRISFSRQKTSRQYDIAITQKAQSILNYYLKYNRRSVYLFPIITEKDIQKQYYQVQEARKRFNKRLKIIAKICGIEKNLTSYVSRHSFATIAKKKGVPISAISEMLGHENIRTTQVYLDQLPSDTIDKYHEEILGD